MSPMPPAGQAVGDWTAVERIVGTRSWSIKCNLCGALAQCSSIALGKAMVFGKGTPGDVLPPCSECLERPADIVLDQVDAVDLSPALICGSDPRTALPALLGGVDVAERVGDGAVERFLALEQGPDSTPAEQDHACMYADAAAVDVADTGDGLPNESTEIVGTEAVRASNIRRAHQLEGLRFGSLMVLTRDGHIGKNRAWTCECDCGRTHRATTGSLESGVSTSCGCGTLGKWRARGRQLPIGAEFGDWRVLSGPIYGAHEGSKWTCECACGTVRDVHGRSLSRGRSQSCGCKEGMRDRKGHPLYRRWSSMIARCTNPRDASWTDYGGRGITVCDRWLSFAAFVADMGDCPSGMSLDRVDNNGNYESANCRWATPSEQGLNRRVSLASRPIAPVILSDRDAEDDYLAAITAALLSSPRSRQTTIGPSEFSPCDRQIAGKLSGLPKPERASWRPATGTAVHTFLEKIFDAAEQMEDGSPRWLTERRVKVGAISGRPLSGSCDLYDRLTHTTVDHKYVGTTTLKAARSGKISEKYRTQQQLYAHGLVASGLPVSTVAICYLPSAGELDDFVWWSEPYDPTTAERALERVNGIANAVGAGADMSSFAIADDWCGSCAVLTAGLCLGYKIETSGPIDIGAIDMGLRIVRPAA